MTEQGSHHLSQMSGGVDGLLKVQVPKNEVSTQIIISVPNTTTLNTLYVVTL